MAVLVDLFDTLAWGNWRLLVDPLAARAGVSVQELDGAFERTHAARNTGAYGSVEEDLGAVLRACGREADPPLLRELARLERTFFETEVHLYEDAVPVLRDLRARNVRTAIVSNCSHATRPVVERLGLTDAADAVILSFEVGAAKPDSAIFQIALRRLDVEAPRAVFVDDRSDYLDGAAALGIRTLLIRRDVAFGEATENGGHAVISDLAPLLA